MTNDTLTSVLDKQDKIKIQDPRPIDPEFDISTMSAEIIKICKNLSEENDSFDKVQTTILIENYILCYKRFLYNVISHHIFSGNDPGTIHSNIESLLSYVTSNDYKTAFNSRNKSSNQTDELYCIKKSVIKLLDHANLAEIQYVNLKQSDNDYKDKFNLNIIPVKNDIEKQLSGFTRDMTSQLISLIGIFTAMSFLVFGGINSLDNIFKSADNIPILKLMIVGCIWGICILNLIFVFMFFISKMTQLNIKSAPEGNLIQKYPLVWWSNLIICTILLLTIWLFYIDYYNIGSWFLSLNKDNTYTSTLGFIIIILFFVISSRFILKKYSEIPGSVKPTTNENQPIVDDFQDAIQPIIIGDSPLITQSSNINHELAATSTNKKAKQRNGKVSHNKNKKKK
ncbi:hypothetical protein [Lacrimispora sp.]|uniref:hypothetical protein n=1 Tax=Lacrimispora sp. TaxID=2719234 RepID=UPI002FD9BE02